MRRFCVAAALCAVVAVFAGCSSSWYRAPVMPGAGVLFSDVSAPLTTEFDGQQVSSKQGEAKTVGVLGLLAFGDCGVQAAARNGNLQKIHYCDYKFMNVLGLFQQFTVVAYGE